MPPVNGGLKTHPTPATEMVAFPIDSARDHLYQMSIMNDTNVPSPTPNVANAQERLAEALPGLTPELRKAAVWVLENPSAISISSVRQIAESAGVKPNTLVRMARAADAYTSP